MITAKKPATRKQPTQAELRQAEWRAQRFLRTLAVIAAIPVGLYTAWVSYCHGVHVVLAAGENAITAHLFFFSVEGMMMVSAVAIVSKHAGQIAYLSFSLGIAATLAVNILAANPTVVARAIAVWPAITLILTLKMLLALTIPHAPKRATPKKSATVVKKAVTVPQPKPITTRKRNPEPILTTA